MSPLKTKIKESKRGAFFLKYFVILAVIIVIGFLITGITLMLLVARFSSEETLNKLQDNAIEISETTAEILCSDLALHNPEAAALLFYDNIKTTADSTESTVFICNNSGEIITCSNALTTATKVIKNPICEAHASVRVPKPFLTKAEETGFKNYTKLGEVFTESHAVAISPIIVENEVIGFAVTAAAFSGNTITYFIRILTSFLAAAIIALVILTLALFFLADKMTKPIRQLATAARCYSVGDFSYKVPMPKEENEMSELVAEFNAMAESLEALENSRRDFVASVSHEFKTPMTTIGGFINGILDGTIPQEKQGYYLEIVSSEVKRLSKMVNAMLNISRIESGNTTLNIEHFDISNKLLNNFLGFEQMISGKHIEIEGLEDLPKLIVPGDPSMLEQVIYNLIDNAVKFTNKNGKIIVNSGSNAKFIYFSITNTGKGIPSEHLKNIFDRFYKVDKSRSTDTKSTGLGLYLVKSIVELHGGKITVESEIDKFTRFTVKLPK